MVLEGARVHVRMLHEGLAVRLRPEHLAGHSEEDEGKAGEKDSIEEGKGHHDHLRAEVASSGSAVAQGARKIDNRLEEDRRRARKSRL